MTNNRWEYPWTLTDSGKAEQKARAEAALNGLEDVRSQMLSALDLAEEVLLMAEGEGYRPEDHAWRGLIRSAVLESHDTSRPATSLYDSIGFYEDRVSDLRA